MMPLIALKRTVTGGKQSLSTNKGICRGERLEQKLKFQIALKYLCYCLVLFSGIKYCTETAPWFSVEKHLLTC